MISAIVSVAIYEFTFENVQNLFRKQFCIYKLDFIKTITRVTSSDRRIQG